MAHLWVETAGDASPVWKIRPLNESAYRVSAEGLSCQVNGDRETLTESGLLVRRDGTGETQWILLATKTGLCKRGRGAERKKIGDKDAC
jgi:hypothetical protein